MSADAPGYRLDLEMGIDLTLSESVSEVERPYSANDIACDVRAW